MLYTIMIVIGVCLAVFGSCIIYDSVVTMLGIPSEADETRKANDYVNAYVSRQDRITHDNAQFKAIQNDRAVKEAQLAKRLKDARERDAVRRKYLLQDMFKSIDTSKMH